MAIATLSIDLVAKLASLESGFAKAQALAEKSSSQMSQAFSTVENAAKMIGEALASAFVVHEIVDFIGHTIEAAARMEQLSKATQMSVAQIGGIGFAASQTGTDLDTAAISMGRFNVAIGKAADGNKLIGNAFRAMGIDIKDSNGEVKNASLLLAEVSDKFVGYADGPTKAALAQALFGRGYIAMMPMLDQGGAKILEQVGYWDKFSGITGETAKHAEELRQTFGRLQLVSDGLHQQLTGALMPGLQAVSTQLLRMVEAGTGMSRFKDAVQAAFQGVVTLAALVALDFTLVGISIAGLAAMAVTFATGGGVRGLNSVLLSWKADADSAISSFKKLGEAAAQTQAAWNPDKTAETKARLGIVDKPLPAAPIVPIAVPKVAKEKVDAVDEYMRKLMDETNTLVFLGTTAATTEKAMLDMATNPRFKDATDAQKAAILDLAKGIDSLKDKRLPYDAWADMTMRYNAAQEDAIRYTDALDAAFKRLVEATPTGKIADFNAELAVLQSKLNEGKIDAQLYAEMFNNAFDKLPDSIKGVGQQMDNFAKTAAKNIQTSLGDTIYQSFKGTSGNILATWGDMLLKMAAQAAAANIAKALFGEGGGGSGWGALIGMFSGLFGGGGGSAPAAGGGIKFGASGGDFAANSLTVVNERGPEMLRIGGRDMLMLGSQPGHITPTAGAGPTINFQIAAGVSRGEVAALIPTLTEHIKAELLLTMRRPGYQRT